MKKGFGKIIRVYWYVRGAAILEQFAIFEKRISYEFVVANISVDRGKFPK